MSVHAENQIPFFPGMLIGQRNRTVITEDSHGIDEFNLVLTEIARSFFLVPFVLQLLPLCTVYTAYP